MVFRNTTIKSRNKSIVWYRVVSAMEKNKAETWKRSGGVGMVYALRRVIKESFTDNLSPWQRLKVGL